MQIRDDAVLTWLDKLKSNPNKRPKNKYYCFHQDHGHDTSKCYDLKQQIETLIKQGKLQRFVWREKASENPSKDLEPIQWTKERLRALLGEIRAIVRGSMVASSFRKARKTYLRMM